MTFKLGLTGSIGMGKSTTAKMFETMGCDLWDADAAVHRLYSKGGAAVDPMGKAFPSAIIDGAVSRDVLRKIIGNNPSALKTIEMIVHPLVGQDRADFIAQSKSDIIVFDIPLLFETGGDARMDAVACVSIDEDTQRARVMERGTMSEAQFEQILAKQMPIAEKRERSDYVIETTSIGHARIQVSAIIGVIKSGLKNA